MNEAERKQRNNAKLQELHPAVRVRMGAVLQEMERFGYRPRIQEAWRSIKDQLAAYEAGKSKVRYGFHNVTGAKGTKEALAADVIDDDRPFNTKTDFMLHLLAAAEKNELTTGIRWSLSDSRVKLIEDAIAQEDWKRPVWVGWDPLHVEVTGITIPQTETGKRPEMPGKLPSEQDDSAKDEEGKFKLELVKYRVVNIETKQARDYELKTTLRPVMLLPVPYIAQLGARVESDHNDTGSIAVSIMVSAYNGSILAPNALYGKYNTTRTPFLNITQVRNALAAEGVLADIKGNMSTRDLFVALSSGIPVILAMNYRVLSDANLTEKTFLGPHFSVAIGIDLKNIYLHDPLFTDPENGSAHPYPLDIFLKAWTDTTRIQGYSIPQRSSIVPAVPLGTVTAKRVRITADRLNVRQGPGAKYAVLDVLEKSEEFNVLREAGGWGEIAQGHWINLAYTEIIPMPAPTPLPVSEHEGKEVPIEPSEPEMPEAPKEQVMQGLVLNLHLATSVPENPVGPLPAQYSFKDRLIPSSHRNLCGDIALSMVYETITHKENTLGYIYQGSKSTSRKPASGTIAYELAQQFANTFPAGWKAHCHYLSYQYDFEAGQQRHLQSSPGALKQSLTQKTPAELKGMISKMIMDRTFVVIGVTQNTRLDGPGAARLMPKGTGHWVVATGVSDLSIFINNPYMNRRETYSWNEFLACFSYWLLQIVPPAAYQLQAYYGPIEPVRASLEQDRNKA